MFSLRCRLLLQVWQSRKVASWICWLMQYRGHNRPQVPQVEKWWKASWIFLTFSKCVGSLKWRQLSSSPWLLIVELILAGAFAKNISAFFLKLFFNDTLGHCGCNNFCFAHRRGLKPKIEWPGKRQTQRLAGGGFGANAPCWKLKKSMKCVQSSNVSSFCDGSGFQVVELGEEAGVERIAVLLGVSSSITGYEAIKLSLLLAEFREFES